MREKTSVEEQERQREMEYLQQRHAEIVNEIDQMFVRNKYGHTHYDVHNLPCVLSVTSL